MNFRGRSVQSSGDIQWFIDNHVQEAIDLEYKSQSYGGSDENRRELLRDVTSLANAEGGFILLGIEADDEGIATHVAGVERGNYAELIMSSCLANIDRRIQGLASYEIELTSNHQIVVIAVPKSLTAPHMVTHKGLNQFWKRHGRQKSPMVTSEIIDTVEAGMNASERLERYILQREQTLLAVLGNTPLVTICACPVLMEEEVIDTRSDEVRALMGAPQTASLLYGSELDCGPAQPTLEGLLADSYFRAAVHEDGPSGEYLELHRNGYCEFADCIASPSAGIPSVSVAIEVHGFIEFAGKLFSVAGINGPFVIWMKLLNIQNFWLDTPSYLQGATYRQGRQRHWPNSILATPKFTIFDFGVEGHSKARLLNDRLWNAFRYDAAHIYDEQGTLRVMD